MDDIPFVIKLPEVYEELHELIHKRKDNEISIIIQRIREYNHISLDTDNKKKLKVFYQLLLQYSQSLEYYRLNEYMLNTHRHYIDLGLTFPEVINTFFKEKFQYFEKVLHSKESFEDLDILLKNGVVLSYLSLNSDLTNQFCFNFVVIISQLTKKMSTNKANTFLYKSLLLSTLVFISKFSNLYNPFIINTIEVLLWKLGELEKIEFDEKQLESLKVLFPSKTDLDLKSILTKAVDLIINSLNEVTNLYKSDINYDALFDTILASCSKLLQSENIIINLQRSKLVIIIKNIQINIDRSKSKKSTHINFFVEKKKEIESLNPEIDPEYDFSLSWGEKKNLLKNKTKNSIIKKVKKTKREAIRNLKKESRLIDMERQKERSKVDQKRKEEIKLSNQFIEQTNMEYKKLRTSQTKKKDKKKRETRKAGNQV